MSAQSVALAHYRRRARRARALEREAAKLWRQVARADIAGSWEPLMLRLLVALTAAQRESAGEADAYLGAVLAAQNLEVEPVRINPAALAGIASDGRSLETLLRQPVITAKVALAGGATPSRAMASGQAALQMIVGTQVADAGRVADGVALTAQRQATGYVRMVVGKTCSRCLILAGKRYAWNQGFRRHPRCDCIHIPAAEDTANDLRTDPRAAFDAMAHEEQDRVFGKAGAQAIREGADMARVVNARRGMYEAGGRQFTTEGAGRRPRLMPEQVYREAKGNRDEAIRLLRLHGYIL